MKVFVVVTAGCRWNDRLVFTVMAESDSWARNMVSQWLESNGHENHKIDKIQGLVSHDVRGILSVGSKLLEQ